MTRERIIWKDYLYLLFVICLPLSWASFVIGSFYRFISIAIILVYVLSVRGKIYLNPDNSNFRRALVYFAIFTMLTIIWGTNMTEGLKNIFGMSLLLAIAYIFAAQKFSPVQQNAIDNCWIFAGAIAAILFLTGGSTSVGIYGSRRTLQILGTATDPNEFGGIFVVTIPVAIHLFFNSDRKVKKIALFLLSLVELYAVLLTGSRGALFGVIIAILFTLLKDGRISPKRLITIVIIALVAIPVVYIYILPLIPGDVAKRLTIQAILEDSGSGRSRIWRQGFATFIQGNPLRVVFGYGAGGLFISNQYGSTGTMHNQLLQVLVNYGIVGLVLYIILCYKTFVSIKRNNATYYGAFLGMMAFSLTLTMSVTYKPLWILLMMSCTRLNTVHDEETIDGV